MDKKNIKWVIGIFIGIIAELIFIIILISAYKLSNDINVTNIISITSGGISIALSFVAIWITLSQGNNSNIINVKSQDALNKITEKINQIGIDINNIDLDTLADSVNTMFDQLHEDISTKLKNTNTEDYEKTSNIIDQSINKTKRETKDTFTSLSSNNSIVTALKQYFEQYNKLTDEQKEIVSKSLPYTKGFKLIFKEGKVYTEPLIKKDESSS
jgi:hypothetical protein